MYEHRFNGCSVSSIAPKIFALPPFKSEFRFLHFSRLREYFSWKLPRYFLVSTFYCENKKLHVWNVIPSSTFFMAVRRQEWFFNVSTKMNVENFWVSNWKENKLRRVAVGKYEHPINQREHSFAFWKSSKSELHFGVGYVRMENIKCGYSLAYRIE